MFCYRCGVRISQVKVFCTNCGTKIRNTVLLNILNESKKETASAKNPSTKLEKRKVIACITPSDNKIEDTKIPNCINSPKKEFIHKELLKKFFNSYFFMTLLILASIIMLLLIIFIAPIDDKRPTVYKTPMKRDEIPKSKTTADKNPEENTVINKKESKAGVESNNEKEENQKSAIDTNDSRFTIPDIKNFILDYHDASVSAIVKNDFSIVEPYLYPEGPRHTEQRDFLKYTSSKKITEELLINKVSDVMQENANTYRVLTHEEYNIAYGNEEKWYKSFDSEYIVKSINNKKLGVYQLVKTTLVKSKKLN